MRKLMLTVQYDGADYAGFQIQPNAKTIQGELQQALAAILGHPVKVHGASRTDAAVHALGQIVTFESSSPIPVSNLARAVDERLPMAVGVVEAREVGLEFDARHDARRKLYCYQIFNRLASSPFIGRYAWHITDPLDVQAMGQAAQALLGRHDFSAFCASGGSATDMVRIIDRLEVCRDGDIVRMYVQGDGFLYKMVRIIVGTLVEVGRGRWEPPAVAEILASQDRGQAGPTAPGCGLWLVRVTYE